MRPPAFVARWTWWAGRSGRPSRLCGVTNAENLPNRADNLPKSWNPSEVEADLYQGWVDAGYFTADATSDKPAYSIVQIGRAHV